MFIFIEIKQPKNAFVLADKTSNIYKMTTEQHKKLLGENVTKTCRKHSQYCKKSIILKAKHIATKIRLSDRIEKLAEKAAYVTLKDHKDNFPSNPSCCQINP